MKCMDEELRIREELHCITDLLTITHCLCHYASRGRSVAANPHVRYMA